MFKCKCGEPRLSLSRLIDETDRRRNPLQDKDHPGTDPRLFPAFKRLHSGIIPEQFRTVTVLVCSPDIRLV